jgi:lipopolysaccharide export system protein LptA
VIKKTLLLVSYFIISLLAKAQDNNEPINIKNSDLFTFKKLNNQEVRILVGNVHITQGRTTIFCDSAIQYTQDNRIYATGKLHLIQDDSVHLYGKSVEYFGDKKLAIFDKDVVLNSGSMRVTTDKLYFNTQDRIAYYLNGGTITDFNNTLTSKRAYFYSRSSEAFFKQNVKMTDNSYLLTTDTLKYNTKSGIATFLAPIVLTQNTDTITCKQGNFNTKNKSAVFGGNARVASEANVLYGDQITFNQITGLGKARGNVKIIDTTEDVTVYGNEAYYNQKLGTASVAKNPYAIKFMEEDTMHIIADTLWSTTDSLGKKNLNAYKNVKMRSNQFEAVTDSLSYLGTDSTINLYILPAIWMDNFQVTSNTIQLKIKGNELHKAYLFTNSILAQQEDTLRYSIIKGRDMIADFFENQVQHIEVSGNGESTYYLRDDDSLYIGMNRITASNISIDFNNQQLSRIKFTPKPEGRIIPLTQLTPEDTYIKGFVWRGTERPKNISEFEKRKGKWTL